MIGIRYTGRGKEKVLRPVHPNAGIGADYKRRILALVDEMGRSYLRWLRACYREHPPRMAMDAAPADELERTIKRLGAQWEKRFAEAAPKLAEYFSKAARLRSDAVLRKILRDAGISVKFQMSAPMRDVFRATVNENVGLIKSIASQFHGQVQGMVMRSVTAGRDLGQLTADLEDRFGVTRKRAALIARDQNNKATASMTRVRQEEVGIEEAIWLHSFAGKQRRPTHFANNGKRYKVAEGWFDPDPKVKRRIWPGELINCRCVSKPVVKGFS